MSAGTGTSGSSGTNLTFPLGPFPVRVRPAFLPCMALVGIGLWTTWQTLLLWLLIMSLAVVVHELGHALAFRSIGLSSEIELHWSGGVTTARLTQPLSRSQSVGTFLAGPLVGLVIGGLALVAKPHLPGIDSVQKVAEFVAWTNLGLSALNLLPVQPLDGGEMLLALVAGNTASLAAELVTGLGIFIAALIGVLAINGIFGLLPFAFFLGTHNVNVLRALNAQMAPARRARARERASLGEPTHWNRWAVASLSAGLVMLVPVVSSLGALGCGTRALFQMRAGRLQRGKGLAVAGLALGTFNLLWQIFWVAGLMTR
jgi:stage IV sporulation protein FB